MLHWSIWLLLWGLLSIIIIIPAFPPSLLISVYAWLPLWLFLIVLGQPWQTMVTLNKQAGSLGPASKEWYQGSQFDFPWLITLFIWDNLLCTVPACLAKQITPSTGKDLELLINKGKQGRQVRLTHLQIEAAGFRSMIRAVYLETRRPWNWL